jgi:hypothetical protein
MLLGQDTLASTLWEAPASGWDGQPGRPPARGIEEGMEADDLLCSRNARSRTPLVGRAQWKINQPPSLKRYRASLEGAFISFDARTRGSTRLPLKKKRGIGKPRAVGIIPPTPYEDDDGIYSCPQPCTGGRSQSAGWTLNPFTEVLLCGSA